MWYQHMRQVGNIPYCYRNWIQLLKRKKFIWSLLKSAIKRETQLLPLRSANYDVRCKSRRRLWGCLPISYYWYMHTPCFLCGTFYIVATTEHTHRTAEITFLIKNIKKSQSLNFKLSTRTTYLREDTQKQKLYFNLNSTFPIIIDSNSQKQKQTKRNTIKKHLTYCWSLI